MLNGDEFFDDQYFKDILSGKDYFGEISVSVPYPSFEETLLMLESGDFEEERIPYLERGFVQKPSIWGLWDWVFFNEEDNKRLTWWRKTLGPGFWLMEEEWLDQSLPLEKRFCYDYYKREVMELINLKDIKEELGFSYLREIIKQFYLDGSHRQLVEINIYEMKLVIWFVWKSLVKEKTDNYCYKVVSSCISKCKVHFIFDNWRFIDLYLDEVNFNHGYSVRQQRWIEEVFQWSNFKLSRLSWEGEIGGIECDSEVLKSVIGLIKGIIFNSVYKVSLYESMCLNRIGGYNIIFDYFMMVENVGGRELYKLLSKCKNWMVFSEYKGLELNIFEWELVSQYIIRDTVKPWYFLEKFEVIDNGIECFFSLNYLLYQELRGYFYWNKENDHCFLGYEEVNFGVEKEIECVFLAFDELIIILKYIKIYLNFIDRENKDCINFDFLSMYIGLGVTNIEIELIVLVLKRIYLKPCFVVKKIEKSNKKSGINIICEEKVLVGFVRKYLEKEEEIRLFISREELVQLLRYVRNTRYLDLWWWVFL